ncbi:MAG: LamG-like jellyroll fold domain-containing protein [bacterium]
MKKYYLLYLLLTAIIFIMPAIKAISEDTLTVQTFTFDDISKRRDVFQFPAANESFRKVLMYYTLKCDPKTTWDKYNCGEWDYITDTKVYRHTGVMDSTLNKHPLYMVKGQAPLKIELTTTPGTDIYQINQFSRKDPVVTDRKDILVNGEKPQTVDFDGKMYRMQFIVDKATIKAGGFTKANLAGITLYATAGATGYKNFTIRVRTFSPKTSTGFINELFKEVYFKDVDIKEGANEFFFINDFLWSQVSNLLIDISFERNETLPGAILEGYETTNGFIAKSKDPYLSFSGKNDYVDCGLTPEFKNTQKLTYEAWVKVNTWQNWSNIIDLQGLVELQLGDQAGQLYCIVRNPDNTHGNVTGVLPNGSWVHLAMVYDGAQLENSEKLKLYVNGYNKVLSFGSNIPSALPDSVLKLLIGSNNFSGGINDVRIFNTALDEATINEWMNKTKNITTQHPNAANLIRYYSFDEGTGITTADLSTGNQTGKLYGCPQWIEKTPEEINNSSLVSNLPKMNLIFGAISGELEATTKEYSVPEQFCSVHKYKIENHAPIEESVFYSYLSGWHYKYSPNGVKLDSTYNKPTETLSNDTIKYYQKPFEILDDWEIARFITPYGINLDLGPSGFTWVYDVTDFAHMLRGAVDFQAHNTQELVDVKFAFIKGTPPRDLLSLTRVWGKTNSYSYRDLSDDFKLANTTLDILPQAKEVKLISRITGHGHQSNDGNPPHCCEWKDNVHYLYANDKLAYQWHIWRDDCAENPVYPQGGTWPGSREGWCPGDVVRDFEFELGKYVTNGKIDLDYSLTPVPDDNKGMGNGNYVISTYLAQYAAANFTNDMEIYDVISPNSSPLFSRCNPICSNPSIVIRNNGDAEISTFTLEYGVSGGQKETYEYIGKKKIQPNTKDTIELPISSNVFWIGDNAHKFNVNVVSVNGAEDLQPANNSYTTKIDMPDLFSDEIYFELTTNLRGSSFSYSLTDLEGKVYFNRTYLANSRTYRDTVKMKDGCYTIRLNDADKYGLSYWAFPEQGDGSFRIYNSKGSLLKEFNPDCGAGYTYSFNLGPASWVSEAGFDSYFTLAPMPADNYINLGFKKLNGEIQITIFDFVGKTVGTLSTFASNESNYRIDLTNYTPGIYYMLLKSPQGSFKQKFIVK